MHIFSLQVCLSTMFKTEELKLCIVDNNLKQLVSSTLKLPCDGKIGNRENLQTVVEASSLSPLFFHVKSVLLLGTWSSLGLPN